MDIILISSTVCNIILLLLKWPEKYKVIVPFILNLKFLIQNGLSLKHNKSNHVCFLSLSFLLPLFLSMCVFSLTTHSCFLLFYFYWILEAPLAHHLNCICVCFWTIVLVFLFDFLNQAPLNVWNTLCGMVNGREIYLHYEEKTSNWVIRHEEFSLTLFLEKIVCRRVYYKSMLLSFTLTLLTVYQIKLTNNTNNKSPFSLQC